MFEGCQATRHAYPLDASTHALTGDKSDILYSLVCQIAAQARKSLDVHNNIVEEASGVLRNAFQFPQAPYTSALYDQLLYLLSMILEHIYGRHENFLVLQTSSELCAEVLQNSSAGTAFHESTFKRFVNIGQLRFLNLQDTEKCHTALHYYRKAVEQQPLACHLRSWALANLAGTLWVSICWRGKREDILEPIRLFRETLALRLPGHPLRNGALNGLALALEYLSKVSGDRDSSTEAINLYREILGIRAPGDLYYLPALNSLAHALVTQFQWSGDTEILSEAIEAYEEAILLCPGDHPFRDIPRKGLADALFLRHKACSKSIEDLVKATELLEEALEIEPPGHPRRTITLIFLGRSLYSLGERSHSLHSLDECISYLRNVLAAENINQCSRGPNFLELATAL